MEFSNSALMVEVGDLPMLQQYQKIKRYNLIPEFAKALLKSETIDEFTKENFIDTILIPYLEDYEYKNLAQNKFVVFTANMNEKKYYLHENLLSLNELNTFKKKVKRVFTIYIGYGF